MAARVHAWRSWRYSVHNNERKAANKRTVVNESTRSRSLFVAYMFLPEWCRAGSVVVVVTVALAWYNSQRNWPDPAEPEGVRLPARALCEVARSVEKPNRDLDSKQSGALGTPRRFGESTGF